MAVNDGMSPVPLSAAKPMPGVSFVHLYVQVVEAGRRIGAVLCPFTTVWFWALTPNGTAKREINKQTENSEVFTV